MKTLIAVPAMEQIFTVTAQCLMNLRTVDEVFTQFAVRMPVDVARNTLAKYALENEFDRILWIDSDMTFNHYTIRRPTKLTVGGTFDSYDKMIDAIEKAYSEYKKNR